MARVQLGIVALLALCVTAPIGRSARAANPVDVDATAASIEGSTFLDLEGRVLSFVVSVVARDGQTLQAQMTAPMNHDMRGRLASTGAIMDSVVSTGLGGATGTLDCLPATGRFSARKAPGFDSTRIKLKFSCSGRLMANAVPVDVEATLKLTSEFSESDPSNRERMTLNWVEIRNGDRDAQKYRSDVGGPQGSLPGLLANIVFGPDGAPLAVSLPDPMPGPKPNQFTSNAATIRVENSVYPASAVGRYKPDESKIDMATVEPGGKVTLKNYAIDGAGNPVGGTATYSIKGYRGRGGLFPAP